MKPLPPILALASFCFALGCAPSSPPPTSLARHPRPPRTTVSADPVLQAHLDGAWMQDATRLSATDAVLFYHGTAQRSSGEKEPWTGTVRGDILFVSPQRATVIPSGTLTLEQNSSVRIVGPAHTFVAGPEENPSWRVLLSM